MPDPIVEIEQLKNIYGDNIPDSELQLLDDDVKDEYFRQQQVYNSAGKLLAQKQGVDEFYNRNYDRYTGFENREGQSLGRIDIDSFRDYEQYGVNYDPYTGMGSANEQRAERQGGGEQFVSALKRAVLTPVVDIIGQVGAIGDMVGIFSQPDEIGNFITRWADDRKKDINEYAPIYTTGKEGIGDFAWWMENGSALVSSVASFAATGAGLGKALTSIKWLNSLAKSKAFSAIDDVAKAGDNFNKVNQSVTRAGSTIEAISKGQQFANTLITSSALNHAEGLMSAVQVYDNVLEDARSKGFDEEKSKELAGKAAAHTMNVNRINIALNLTSANMFLRKPFGTRSLVKARTKALRAKEYGSEAAQEGLEELVNVYAESKGEESYKKLLKGQDSSALYDAVQIDEILGGITTKEGFEAAFLGAIGGTAQTGITNIPKSKILPTSLTRPFGQKLEKRDQYGNIVTDEKGEIVYENEGNKLSQAEVLDKRLQMQDQMTKSFTALSNTTAKTMSNTLEIARMASATEAIDSLTDSNTAQEDKNTAELDLARYIVHANGEKVTDANVKAQQLEIAKMNQDELNELRDQIQHTNIANQAWQAFTTGTTDNLLGVYDALSNMNSSEAESKGFDPNTYKEEAQAAKDKIRELEKVYAIYNARYSPAKAQKLFMLHSLKDYKQRLMDAKIALDNESFEIYTDEEEAELKARRELFELNQKTIKGLDDEYYKKANKIVKEYQELVKKRDPAVNNYNKILDEYNVYVRYYKSLNPDVESEEKTELRKKIDKTAKILNDKRAETQKLVDDTAEKEEEFRQLSITNDKAKIALGISPLSDAQFIANRRRSIANDKKAIKKIEKQINKTVTEDESNTTKKENNQPKKKIIVGTSSLTKEAIVGNNQEEESEESEKSKDAEPVIEQEKVSDEEFQKLHEQSEQQIIQNWVDTGQDKSLLYSEQTLFPVKIVTLSDVHSESLTKFTKLGLLLDAPKEIFLAEDSNAYRDLIKTKHPLFDDTLYEKDESFDGRQYVRLKIKDKYRSDNIIIPTDKVTREIDINEKEFKANLAKKEEIEKAVTQHLINSIGNPNLIIEDYEDGSSYMGDSEHDYIDLIELSFARFLQDNPNIEFPNLTDNQQSLISKSIKTIEEESERLSDENLNNLADKAGELSELIYKIRKAYQDITVPDFIQGYNVRILVSSIEDAMKYIDTAETVFRRLHDLDFKAQNEEVSTEEVMQVLDAIVDLNILRNDEFNNASHTVYGAIGDLFSFIEDRFKGYLEDMLEQEQKAKVVEKKRIEDLDTQGQMNIEEVEDREDLENIPSGMRGYKKNRTTALHIIATEQIDPNGDPYLVDKINTNTGLPIATNNEYDKTSLSVMNAIRSNRFTLNGQPASAYHDITISPILPNDPLIADMPSMTSEKSRIKMYKELGLASDAQGRVFINDNNLKRFFKQIPQGNLYAEEEAIKEKLLKKKKGDIITIAEMETLKRLYDRVSPRAEESKGLLFIITDKNGDTIYVDPSDPEKGYTSSDKASDKSTRPIIMNMLKARDSETDTRLLHMNNLAEMWSIDNGYEYVHNAKSFAAFLEETKVEEISMLNQFGQRITIPIDSLESEAVRNIINARLKQDINAIRDNRDRLIERVSNKKSDEKIYFEKILISDGLAQTRPKKADGSRDNRNLVGDNNLVKTKDDILGIRVADGKSTLQFRMSDGEIVYSNRYGHSGGTYILTKNGTIAKVDTKTISDSDARLIKDFILLGLDPDTNSVSNFKNEDTGEVVQADARPIFTRTDDQKKKGITSEISKLFYFNNRYNAKNPKPWDIKYDSDTGQLIYGSDSHRVSIDELINNDEAQEHLVNWLKTNKYTINRPSLGKKGYLHPTSVEKDTDGNVVLTYKAYESVNGKDPYIDYLVDSSVGQSDVISESESIEMGLNGEQTVSTYMVFGDTNDINPIISFIESNTQTQDQVSTDNETTEVEEDTSEDTKQEDTTVKSKLVEIRKMAPKKTVEQLLERINSTDQDQELSVSELLEYFDIKDQNRLKQLNKLFKFDDTYITITPSNIIGYVGKKGSSKYRLFIGKGALDPKLDILDIITHELAHLKTITIANRHLNNKTSSLSKTKKEALSRLQQIKDDLIEKFLNGEIDQKYTAVKVGDTNIPRFLYNLFGDEVILNHADKLMDLLSTLRERKKPEVRLEAKDLYILAKTRYSDSDSFNKHLRRNLNEIIASAYESKEMQELLNGIKNKEGKSFWSNMLQIIADLLTNWKNVDVDPSSLLSQAISDITTISRDVTIKTTEATKKRKQRIEQQKKEDKDLNIDNLPSNTDDNTELDDLDLGAGFPQISFDIDAINSLDNKVIVDLIKKVTNQDPLQIIEALTAKYNLTNRGAGFQVFKMILNDYVSTNGQIFNDPHIPGLVENILKPINDLLNFPSQMTPTAIVINEYSDESLQLIDGLDGLNTRQVNDILQGLTYYTFKYVIDKKDPSSLMRMFATTASLLKAYESSFESLLDDLRGNEDAQSSEIFEVLSNSDNVYKIMNYHASVVMKDFGIRVNFEKDIAQDEMEAGRDPINYNAAIYYNTKDGSPPIVKMLFNSIAKQRKIAIHLREEQLEQYRKGIDTRRAKLLTLNQNQVNERNRLEDEIRRIEEIVERKYIVKYEIVKNQSGFPILENGNTIYNYVIAQTANTENKFEAILKKLQQIADNERRIDDDTAFYAIDTLVMNIKTLSSRTTNDAIRFQTTISQALSKIKLEHNMVLVKGGKFRIVDSNPNRTANIIRRNWKGNYINGLIEFNQSRSIENPTKLSLEFLNDVKQEFETTKRLRSTKEAVKKALKRFGIEFNDFDSTYTTMHQRSLDPNSSYRSLYDVLDSILKYADENLSNGSLTDIFSSSESNQVRGSINTLIEYAAQNPSKEIDNQFVGPKGQTIYAYTLGHSLSTVVNLMNAHQMDIRAALPYLNSVYSKNSRILDRLHRNMNVKLNLIVDSGVKTDTYGSRGLETSDLGINDLYTQRINQGLKNHIYNIPQAGDREVTNSLQLRDTNDRPVRLINSIQDAKMVFLNYLLDEINSIRFANANDAIINSLKVDKKKMTKLRHFDKIISSTKLKKELFDFIEQSNAMLGKTDNIPTDLRAKLANAIDAYLDRKTTELYDRLEELGLIDATLKNYHRAEDGTTHMRFDIKEEGKKNSYISGLQGIDDDIYYTFYKATDPSLELTPRRKQATRNLLKTYLANQKAVYIESFKLFFGDPAMFKNEDDLFKRIKMFNSTRYASSTSKDLNDVLNASNKLLLYKDGRVSKVLDSASEQAYLNGTLNLTEDEEVVAEIGYRTDGKTEDNLINTLVLDDVVVVSDLVDDQFDSIEYRDGDIVFLDDKGNAIDESEIATLTKEFARSFINDGITDSRYLTLKVKSYTDPYKNIEETDAASWVSIDEYKSLMIRNGEFWIKDHEIAYNKILSNKDLSEFELTLFQPQKTQYTGPMMNQFTDGTNSISVITAYKHAILPLIPQAIKGTQLEKVAEYMRDNQVGLIQFQSGNKFGTIKEVKSKMYKADGSDNIANWPTEGFQQIHYDFYGIQVPIRPKRKNKVTASTQARKIILSRMYNNGKINSEFKDIEDTLDLYDQLQKEITDRSLNQLMLKLGVEKKTIVTYDEDNNPTGEEQIVYEINDTRMLIDLLHKEAARRNSDINIIASINSLALHLDRNMVGDTGVYIEELNIQNAIDSLLASIINNRIIKEQRKGESLVQTTSAGWNSNNVLRASKSGSNKVGSNTELKFYRKGKNSTIPMQIQIGLPTDYHYLVTQYGNLDSLNSAVKQLVDKVEQAEMSGDDLDLTKDEKNLLNLITVSGFRIPNQSPNSNDAARIVKFLPEIVGVSVVVPPEMVAKTGSDHDWDKLNVYLPHYAIIDGKMIYKSTSDSELEIKMYQERIAEQATRFEIDELRPELLTEINDRLITSNKNRKSDLDLANQINALEDLKAKTKAIEDNTSFSQEEIEIIMSNIAEMFDLLHPIISEYVASNMSEIKDMKSLIDLNVQINLVHDAIDQNLKDLDLQENQALVFDRDGEQINMKKDEVMFNLELLKEIGQTLSTAAGEKEQLANVISDSSETIQAKIDALTKGDTPLTIEEILEAYKEEKELIQREITAKYYDTLAEKINTLPFNSFEEFQMLPQMEKYPKSYIENQMIHAINKILLHPNNFRSLMAPISSDILNGEDYGVVWDIRFLRSNSKALEDYKADPTPQNYIKQRDKFISYYKRVVNNGSLTNTIDSLHNIEKFKHFLVGKTNIGIVAKAITHHVLSEKANLYYDFPIELTPEGLLNHSNIYFDCNCKVLVSNIAPKGSLYMNGIFGRKVNNRDYMNKASNVKANNTMDAILDGDRVATSRHGRSLDNVEIGDIVVFTRSTDDTQVKVRVTHKRKVSSVSPEKWAELEGYNVDEVKANWTEGKNLSTMTQIVFEVVQDTDQINITINPSNLVRIQPSNGEGYYKDKSNDRRYRLNTQLFPNFSNSTDSAGNHIMETLSSFLNAYVDVAKDPYIFAMNAGKDTVAIYMYLIRMGADLNWITRFMNQPIIWEYLANKSANKALYKDMNNTRINNASVIGNTLSKYSSKIPKLKSSLQWYQMDWLGRFKALAALDPQRFKNFFKEKVTTNQEVEDVVKRYNSRAIVNTLNDYVTYLSSYNYYINNNLVLLRDIEKIRYDQLDEENTKKYQNMHIFNRRLYDHAANGDFSFDNLADTMMNPDSEKSKRLQPIILQLFLDFERQAGDMRDLSMVTSSDTGGVPNSIEMLLYNITRKQEVLAEGKFNNAENINSDTIIQPFDKIAEETIKLFSSLYFFKPDTKQRDLISTIQNQFASQVRSERDQNRIRQTVIKEFMNFVLHANLGNPNYTNSQWVFENLLNDNNESGRYQDENGKSISLLRYITLLKNKVQSKNIPDGVFNALIDNEFIKELIPIIVERQYPYNSLSTRIHNESETEVNSLTIFNRKMTVHQKNRLINSLEQIKEIDNQFYNDLVSIAIAQGGNTNPIGSYYNLISHSEILRRIAPQLNILNGMNNLQFEHFIDSFYDQFSRSRIDLLPKAVFYGSKPGAIKPTDNRFEFKYHVRIKYAKDTGTFDQILVKGEESEDGTKRFHIASPLQGYRNYKNYSYQMPGAILGMIEAGFGSIDHITTGNDSTDTSLLESGC